MKTNKAAVKAQARQLARETVITLRAKAKAIGMTGYTRYNKANLVLAVATELVKQQLAKLEVKPQPEAKGMADLAELLTTATPETLEPETLEPEAIAVKQPTEPTQEWPTVTKPFNSGDCDYLVAVAPPKQASPQVRQFSTMMPTRQESQDNDLAILETHRAATKPISNVQIFGISLQRIGKTEVRELVGRLESLASNKRVLGLKAVVSLLDICISCLDAFGLKDYMTAPELVEAVQTVGKDAAIKFTRLANTRVRTTLAPMAVYLAKHFWLYFDHTLSLCKAWLVK